ncbi:MAG: OmpA family protein, partial [Cyanobacteria bacterium P01_G01_bin.38]
AQIQTDGGLSSSDAAVVMQGIDFFTSVEANQWMTDGTLAKRIEATAAVLTLAGQLDQVPAQPDSYYTTDFISNAVANTQALIDVIKTDNPELAAILEGAAVQEQTTTPQLEASAVTAAPTIGNLQVTGEVKFATGSANIAPEGQQTLNQLAEEIKEFNVQTVAVRVIGHTSKTGSAALNQQLSQQRAQVVVNYLKQKGVGNNIVAEGKGFNEPLAGVAPVDAKNQRTEIRLVRVN